MIASFKGKFAQAVSAGECPKGFPREVLRSAQRKLASLAAATTLGDLRVPPGNRLEALTGDRSGQHSIRVNDQWRICFRWADGRAEDVEIVDFH
ncbi:type II toxin-antitoxin system RelE/ParE family toxin [Devosia aurantiaca]|uniref:Type II toxin-antitoxin system RelE/ParE family toxin n=1 Tax=Devosia aurantiaca TaxID=2714858 RepID=A0A6M1SX35_9HYPH|nr:type II toxin-antitoxin system RelE/ParE family toxin [Devosia aurantiaca]NGP17401.1 type II toxin-antitoxin system RelE/ParE family toxin [Devosia aurantiaca]